MNSVIVDVSYAPIPISTARAAELVRAGMLEHCADCSRLRREETDESSAVYHVRAGLLGGLGDEAVRVFVVLARDRPPRPDGPTFGVRWKRFRRQSTADLNIGGLAEMARMLADLYEEVDRAVAADPEAYGERELAPVFHYNPFAPGEHRLALDLRRERRRKPAPPPPEEPYITVEIGDEPLPPGELDRLTLATTPRQIFVIPVTSDEVLAGAFVTREDREAYASGRITGRPFGSGPYHAWLDTVELQVGTVDDARLRLVARGAVFRNSCTPKEFGE